MHEQENASCFNRVSSLSVFANPVPPYRTLCIRVIASIIFPVPVNRDMQDPQDHQCERNEIKLSRRTCLLMLLAEFESRKEEAGPYTCWPYGSAIFDAHRSSESGC